MKWTFVKWRFLGSRFGFCETQIFLAVSLDKFFFFFTHNKPRIEFFGRHSGRPFRLKGHEFESTGLTATATLIPQTYRDSVQLNAALHWLEIIGGATQS